MNMPGSLVAGGLLIANTIQDIRKREIVLLPTLLVLAAGVILQIMAPSTKEAETGPWPLALLPGAVLLLLSIAATGTIGFGDGLAACAAGIWCGPEQMFLALFFALLVS